MLAVDEFTATAAVDAGMILQVHDELVLEVAERDVEAVVAQVSARMCDAADLAVDLVVDVGVGDNWDEAH